MKDRRFGIYFKCIVNNFERCVNDWCKDHNLTYQQLHILIAIKRRQENKVKQKDLEEIFEISNATVSGILTRLENRNLIKRLNDETDKRIKNLYLTDDGEIILNSSRENIKKLNDVIVKGLSNEEIDELETLLNKVLTNLKEDKDK